MKILGFNFSQLPTIEFHLQYMFKKFRKRLWLLRNLKKARADSKDLVDCYCCFLRSVLDYCTNVYHPMLSQGQTDTLEKLQYSALKIIFGYDTDKENLLKLSGLSTLQERRKKLFEAFCLKNYKNERFKQTWFEERDFEGADLRKQKIIVEKFARTSRLYNSPVYAMRRKLNDILVS